VQQLIVKFQLQAIIKQFPMLQEFLLEPIALIYIDASLIVRSVESRFIQAELIIVDKVPVAE
jgi:hypothetical protein